MDKQGNWGKFGKLLPEQIDDIKKKAPIAYLPWGALEYHGKHNVVGLDSHKAEQMCIDLAKETGGLVLPVINIAANLISSYPGVDFPEHSIEFSTHLVRAICEEYIEQLVNHDFKIIIVLSGHAGQPHIDILKEVAMASCKKYLECHTWTLTEYEMLEEELLTANHSALGETSIQMYYEPKLVSLDKLPQDRDIDLITDAVSGKDPRLASAERGGLIVKTFVQNTVKKINGLKQRYIP